MKIVFNLNKAARRDRSHLVKVATQVQGKTGQYSSHRWINPNKAMDILKDDLKRQGLKNTDELSFKDKKTGQVINEKELMNRMEKENFKGTLQEYAKQYKIVSGGSNAKTGKTKIEANTKQDLDLDNKSKEFLYSTKDLKIDISDIVDNLSNVINKPNNPKKDEKEPKLETKAPVLDAADFTNKPAQFTDVDKVEYVEEDNYVPGETFQNLKLTNFRGDDGKEALAIRKTIIDNADEYLKGLDEHSDDVEAKRNMAQFLVAALKNMKKKDYRHVVSYNLKGQYTPFELIRAVIDKGTQYPKDESINFYSEEYSKYMTSILRGEAIDDNRALEGLKSRVDYRYRPEQLNGVKRNKPMTFEQADQLRANPNYKMVGSTKAGYTKNCQSAVFVYEMRLRGYDLETLPNRNGTGCRKLSFNTNNAWIDPKNGKNVDEDYGDIVVKSASMAYEIIDNTVQIGERYHFSFPWKDRSRSSHIITVHKNSSGDIVFYDPQSNKFATGKNEVLAFLNRIKYKTYIYGTSNINKTYYTGHKLIRVDNLIPDEEILASVSKPSDIATEGLEEDLDGQGEQETSIPNNIDEETINKIDPLLEPLREEKKENGYGGKGNSPRQVAEKLLKDANDRLGIHLKSKTENDKKAELQANMAAFYNALKAGNITINQAINNPQFKNCAYLFIMALMDEDMEGEIDNFLNQIL